MVAVEITDEDGGEVEEFATQIFLGSLAAMEMLNVELGARLGLYEALHRAGRPTTAPELASLAGIDSRYAREWLEQQAVAKVLDVEDAGAEPDARRFSLSRAKAHVLLDADSEAFMAAFPSFLPVAGITLDRVVEAFRTGGGVAYSDYGIHDIQAAWTKPVFRAHLVDTWLRAVSGLVETLESGEAKVAEIGCGEGFASILIGERFKGAQVDGFDLDEASITTARKEAADRGLAHQVRFQVADCSAPDLSGAYDLVFCVEMLHDASNPVGILASMRRMRAEGGVVLVVDERAEEVFTPDASEMERLFYAFSTLHCLPAGRTEEPSAATGTVIRPATVRAYAEEAGFTSVTELPVEHPQFRIFQLDG
jgi:SAM-dependent methyltransferase